MTLSELISTCPAVTATGPSPDVSASYDFIPTLPIVETLLSSGWEIRAAHQRINDPHAVHRISFSPTGIPQFQTKAYVGQIRPLIHLINSHNRTHRMEFVTGLEVCVCSNQLHIPMEDDNNVTFSRLHLRSHNIIPTLQPILDNTAALGNRIHRMTERELTPLERETFAKQSLAYVEGHGNANFVFADRARSLLAQRRSTTNENSVWATYQIVQENLIECGRTGRGGIHEILRNTKLNRQLWTLAEQTAQN